MDSTIIAALIGAAAMIAAAVLAVLLPGLERRRRRRERTPMREDPTGKLDTRLFIILGEGGMGPVELTLYGHHLPSQMTSFTMDGPLHLPTSMQTRTPRRLFHKDTRKFLVDDVSYAAQGVKPGATLLLTDQLNPEIASVLLETLEKMPRPPG